MEKWHLAAIFTNGSKVERFIPIKKPDKTSLFKNLNFGKNKLISLLHAFLKKTTEVMALF